jgi:hypothetical protein
MDDREPTIQLFELRASYEGHNLFEINSPAITAFPYSRVAEPNKLHYAHQRILGHRNNQW